MIFDRNDIKVTFDRPKYVTEGNKVTCTLNYRILVPSFQHEDRQYTDSRGYNPTAVRAIAGFALGDMHSAVGVAQCSPDDTFDKKTGREIAEARAEAKAYKHAAILVKKFVQKVALAYVDMAYNFEAKADCIQRHDKEYVLSMGK